MKTQKTIWLLLAMSFLGITIVFNGCKNDDDPEPETPKHVWAVGSPDFTNYATIVYSANGGETWIRQGANSAALEGVNLSDVWAIDENIVWAVGNDNAIIKTANGGQDWQSLQSPQKSTYIELNSISIVGSDNIWISGSDGLVYNSTDAGSTWANKSSPVLANTFLQGIHAINNNIVYVTGHRVPGEEGIIARTLDAGQTWDSIVLPNDFQKHEWIGVKAIDENNVVVYGGISYYTYTTDGGLSWTNDSVPGTGGGGPGGSDINCLKMLDVNTWWGAFDLDNIFITEDAGNNWQNIGPASPPGNMWLLGIDTYDRNLCVIVGSSESSNDGKIVRTTDGGTIWETVYETNAWMQKVSFIK